MKSMSKLWQWALLATLAFTGVFGQIQFEDLTDFYEVDNDGNSRGVSFVDYNRDGKIDIFVINSDAQTSNTLYENRGLEFPFRNATDESGLTNTEYGYAATWGDYDNDGWPDLFFTNHGSIPPNRLFRNEGGDPVSFSLMQETIEGAADDAGVTWLDYDGDGFLDLFLVDHHGQGDGFFLYRNNGDGSFSLRNGIDFHETGYGECVVAADLDNDGDTDLYITSYDQDNSESTYLKNVNGVFRRVRNAGGANNPNIRQATGVAVADINNDGWLDLYIANDGMGDNPDRLYLNNGNGLFSDVTAAAGISELTSSFSPVFADFNNDGYVDLYIAKYPGLNRLYLNGGDGTFDPVTGGIAVNIGASWSCAVGDVNADGRPDVYIGKQGANHLLINTTVNSNNHVFFDLTGTTSNRLALNTRVQITAGGMGQIREITGSSGYMSQNSPAVQFGLGTAEIIDEVEIHWPSGIVEYAMDLEVNRKYAIVEGPPAAPQNLSGTSGQGGHPYLTWDANIEADLVGYHVYRKNENDVVTQLTEEPVAETDFLDTESYAGWAVTVWYFVKAADYTEQLSDASNEVEMWLAPGPLGKPTLAGLPNRFDLHEAFPNPFNPVTTIRYAVPTTSQISLKIHDLRGREVETLFTGHRNPGNYELLFDASSYASGVYFCHLTAPGFSQVVKLSVVK